MDLRMFMEEDMVDFLDTHLSTENLRKQSAKAHHEDFAGLLNDDSYESKLFSALDKNDVVSAKKILHEVKDAILEKPVGSVERKQLEATLHTLYKKFKHYIETVSLVNKFEDDLESVAHPNSSSSESSELDEKISQSEKLNVEDDSLDVYLLDIQHAIAINDLSEAKKAYEQAKNEFAKLSTTQKKQYHKKLLLMHKSIQDLLSHNSSSNEEKSRQETNDEIASGDSYAVNSDLVSANSNGIEQELATIQNAIKQKDFVSAKKSYEKAKDEFAKLPTQEKKQYHKRLLSLGELIVHSLPEESSMGHVEENLKQAMDEGDLHEAMLHYEELRSLIRELPEDERAQHTQRAKKYYSWIMTAWNSWQSGHPALEEKEKRLSGRP